LDVDLAQLRLPLPASDLLDEPYGSTIAIAANGAPTGTAQLSPAYGDWRVAWAQQRQELLSATREAAQQRICASRCRAEHDECEREVVRVAGPGKEFMFCTG
jgi:hypothetical protein